ncbi:hypothetical protein [Microbacterium plantarum]|uniref:hypothetical protein n=1 Tax=Microbacterium plantarum TaxID=1816425 RepID=UPI002B4909CB|nr:hypothetical protein [Microbacterium plantarum]WRK16142.1 hypothetical protein VC184_09430 [Microbacterium plantarum]
MSERIDHAAEAASDIRYADEVLEQGADLEVAKAIAAVGQVQATLALVEQQRIANIIALSSPQEALDGAECRIPSFVRSGSVPDLRDDIREGLGL